VLIIIPAPPQWLHVINDRSLSPSSLNGLRRVSAASEQVANAT
jgi:hypothetical protein